jgi:hypothetical protein
MKSLNKYSKNNFSFINSIQSRIENPMITEEYELVRVHGKYIDSIFEKLDKYTYRISNPNYINESDKDVLFILEEQIAIRDMFVTISNSYQKSLVNEFCNKYNINLDNTLITEAFNVSTMTNALSKSLQNAGDAAKAGFEKLKGALSCVAEFLKSVINKAIKTAKDLFAKFTEMMVSFGEKLYSLIDKLTGGEAKSYEKTFYKFTRQIADQESSNKGKNLNTFETLSNKLNAGEQITEEYLAEVFPIYEDEYSDAANAKAGKKKKGMSPALQALLQMAAYHLTVTVIPLVITIASGGSLMWLAAFIEDIAAAAWGSVAFYKQCKHIYNTLKSREFKERTLFYKIFSILWWLFCLVMSASAVAKGVKGLLDKIKFLAEGGKLAHILPSDHIINWAKKINEWAKDWFGKTDDLKCLDAYKQILEEKEMVQLAKDAQEIQKQKNDAAAKGEDFDIRKTNEFKKWEQEYGEDAAKYLKEKIVDRKDFTIGKNSNIWDEYTKLKNTLDTGDQTLILADSTAKSLNGARMEIAQRMNVDPSSITLRQVSNTAVYNATNGNYGTSWIVSIDAPATAENIEKYTELINNAGAEHCTVLSKIVSTTEQVLVPVKSLIGQHIPFAGLMPIVQKSMKRGGFKMRLGSGRTKGHIYLIPDEDFVRGIPYSKFVNEYMDKNPKAIKEMQKYFNQNLEQANKAKELLENKDKLSKEEKKKLNAITDFIERSKEGKSEFEVLVFNTNDKFANGEFGESKRKSKKEVTEALAESGCTNEEIIDILEYMEFDADDMTYISEGLWDKIKSGYKKTKEKVDAALHKVKYKKGVSQEDVENMNKEDEKDKKEKERQKKIERGETVEDEEINSGEQYPVMFFNPLILCGGDLAPRERTKGPRAHIYTAKGILSRIELLPIDKGMSGKDIFEMFANFLKEGIKACYDVTYDVPCYKDGRKYVENQDSEYKDKERMDFGGFTNKQVTDFMNDNNLAYKYLGGDYATDTISGGKHKYIEQDDTEEKKKHNEEVIKDFKELILNNDKIKEYIKSTKTLSKVLFDKDGNLKEDRFTELLRDFMRVENTYLKGDDKDGLFKKIKNFFKSEIDPDPSEVKQLSLKLAEERKKMLKKKVKESFDEEYYNIILEANIEILENEFEILWENN